MTLSALPTSSADPEESPARIHGALAYRPGVPCMIAHDISVHPSRSRPPPGMSVDQYSDILAQPATNPPLPAMTLVTSFLPNYPIVVTPAGADKGTGSPHTPNTLLSPGSVPARPLYVTVHDVLTTLYTFLRIPLSPDEYNALSVDHQRDVARAYSVRVHRLDERKREAERAKGVKRIDLLLAEGRAMFDGLGATKRSRALWVLNLRS
jgi:hypothetical protein